MKQAVPIALSTLIILFISLTGGVAAGQGLVKHFAGEYSIVTNIIGVVLSYTLLHFVFRKANFSTLGINPLMVCAGVVILSCWPFAIIIELLYCLWAGFNKVMGTGK